MATQLDECHPSYEAKQERIKMSSASEQSQNKTQWRDCERLERPDSTSSEQFQTEPLASKEGATGEEAPSSGDDSPLSCTTPVPPPPLSSGTCDWNNFPPNCSTSSNCDNNLMSLALKHWSVYFSNVLMNYVSKEGGSAAAGLVHQLNSILLTFHNQGSG